MKLIVFGATGRTGRVVVAHALAAGHQVRTLVRTPEHAGLPAGVEIQCGDVRDADVVGDIVNGAEVVVSCLGAKLVQTFTAEGRVNTFGMPNIVAAMRTHGTRRIVAMSSYGAGDSFNRMGTIARLGLATVMRGVLADMNALEQALQASELDWTVVRPTNLSDRPATGRIAVDTGGRIGIGSWISRADVADFMLRILGDHTYVRRVVLLSGTTA